MKLEHAAKVIAKKLLQGEPFPLDLEHIDMMKGDLKKLSCLEIYVTDIHEKNYVGAKLVDLSAAWVMPLVEPHERVQSYKTEHQLYQLQLAILENHHRLPIGIPAPGVVEREWKRLLCELKFRRFMARIGFGFFIK
jgi:hypothetical protein